MASLTTVPYNQGTVQSFKYTSGLPKGRVESFKYSAPLGTSTRKAFTYFPRGPDQTVVPTGIASGEVMGTPILLPHSTLVATGIPSAQAIGAPALREVKYLGVTGIASAEAIGFPEVGGAKFLGGYALVQATPLRTLGGNAYVRAESLGRAYGYARVSRRTAGTLGGLAVISVGPVFGGMAGVQARTTSLLGGNALCVLPGAAEQHPRWFPADGRRLGQEETGYLQIVYKNYPLASGQADVRWEWDGVVLPVNGVKLDLKEPVREIMLETLGARVITVIEEELDTPRTTRAREFEIEFPASGIQFLQWLKSRQRIGRDFVADIRLFDVSETDHWELLYTDRSDTRWAFQRYWGSLPSWKPGTLKLRLNGSEITDFTAAALGVNPTLGFVEFAVARDPDDRVEVQYVYSPTVRIVNIDNLPKPGYAFNRFSPKVKLKELSAHDPAYSETVGIAPPPLAGWSDTFMQADGVRLQLDTAQAWDGSGGFPPYVTGNQASNNPSDGLFVWANTGEADGLLEADCSINGALAGYPYLIARYSDDNNYLAWQYTGSPLRFQLVKIVAGVGTVVYAGAIGQINATARLGLLLDGSSVTPYVDGVRQGTFVIPQLTTGTRHGFSVFDLQRVDNFSFRTPEQIYAGYLPPDPNTDWLTGNPVYDDFVKPDGGPGLLQTGQVWEFIDGFYPAQVISHRLNDAHVGVKVPVATPYGRTQWRVHQGVSAGTPWVVVRYTDVSNYIAFGPESGVLKIMKCVAGVFTTLATGPAWTVTPGNFGDLKLEITLTGAVKGYWDGVLVCSAGGPVTDFNTVSRVGILMGSSNNSGSRFSHTSY